jgi:sec-independent protein translocase protein TatB
LFDIGWSEMAVIMLLALIIIGPKDLPRVARTIGQWVRKGRALAREFQTSLEDMARESELDDVRKEIEKVGRTDFKKSIQNTIDPKGELTKAFDTSPDQAETKPAKPEIEKPAANGHVNGAAASSSSAEAPGKMLPPSESEPDAGSTANGTATPKTGAKAKTATRPARTTTQATKPAAKTKAAKATTAKTSTAKTTAAKKPVSAAKSSAKPSASASSSKASTGASQRGVEPPPVDEGGGSDPSAVAAKPS